MPPAFQRHADLPIRRGCVIAGLAALGAMLALAPHPVLALRLGAEVAALLTLGLLLAAWRAPARPPRADAVDALLRQAGAPRGRLPAAQGRAALALLLRERLLWHAERVALAALALWAAALALWSLGH